MCTRMRTRERYKGIYILYPSKIAKRCTSKRQGGKCDQFQIMHVNKFIHPNNEILDMHQVTLTWTACAADAQTVEEHNLRINLDSSPP